MYDKPLIFVIISVMIFIHNSYQNSRIINGKPILIDSVPAQASLFRRSTFICGAVLISRRTAITAAHCLTKGSLMPNQFQLYYGSEKLSSEHSVSIIRITLFPAFSQITLNYDIAVLTLESSVNVSFALLPDVNSNIKPETPVTAVGWGITEDGFKSQVLLAINMLTISLEQCKEDHPNLYISDNMFCASTHNSTVCNGDSGGGIYMIESSKSSILLGLVSWGIECTPKPAGFVDLTNLEIREWLSLLIV